MSHLYPKLVVIISKSGVESVTVQAADNESRRVGYKTCQALEPVFANLDQVVKGINQQPDEMGVN